MNLFMRLLRRHPFPVVARFDRVVALSFAFPQEALRPLVPTELQLDAYRGFGFVTVALVWTRSLRPAGFPERVGNDFFLAGYRVFTRMTDATGRTRRGLKILHSETDSPRMVLLGNLMTHYGYRKVRVATVVSDRVLRVTTDAPANAANVEIAVDLSEQPPHPPAGSPFPDWRTARRFAGPMPFTFSPEGNGRFVVIEGSRSAWQPRPVSVVDWRVDWFASGPLQAHRPILANAFVVENVDYRWEKGQVVKAGGNE